MPDPVFMESVLKKAGLEVTVLDGAYERGHGDMWDIWGLMDHHTGASGNSSPWSIAQHPSLGLCSQIFLPRNGKPVICGVGIAWHGGAGSGFGIRDVNAQLIGMEMDNNGTEGWGSSQYWGCVKVNASIFNHLRLGSDRSIGHKEWAGQSQGKWDPGGMNMVKLRSDISAMQKELLGVQAPPPPNQIDHVRSFSPWLGDAVSGELNVRGKIPGKVRRYQKGNIYWRADLNRTVPVPAFLLKDYERYDFEAGPLGFPSKYHAFIKDPKTGLDIGEAQGFDNGMLIHKYGQDKGWPAWGKIGDRWFKSEQAERGPFGFPIGDEYKSGELILQDFEGGTIAFDPDGTFALDRGDRLYIPPGR